MKKIKLEELKKYVNIDSKEYKDYYEIYEVLEIDDIYSFDNVLDFKEYAKKRLNFDADININDYIDIYKKNMEDDLIFINNNVFSFYIIYSASCMLILTMDIKHLENELSNYYNCDIDVLEKIFKLNYKV